MEAQALSPDIVRDAVLGDPSSVRRVIAALTPVVRVNVAKTLLRFRGRARGRPVAQEADDLVQDVFVDLFQNGGRVLLAWDPARGMTLTSFVALVATRNATRALMGRARDPWRDDPTESEVLDAPTDDALGPEARLATRDFAERIYDALRAELSPLGFRVFTLLFLKDVDVEAACAELTMTSDAVYAWRSRIAKTIRKLASDLDAQGSARADRLEGGR